MKVLIVSDTHGRHGALEEVIEKERPFQRIIHLGDAEGYEDYIEELAGCPLDIVAGNNDYFSQLPKDKEILLDGLRVFLTHGHYYYVTSTYDYICREAINRGMDVAMFGHTHRPVLREEKGITLLNPGSLAYPRQPGRKPSYAVMEKAHGRPPVFEIKYLEEE